MIADRSLTDFDEMRRNLNDFGEMGCESKKKGSVKDFAALCTR
jgi:hypothetical protein